MAKDKRTLPGISVTEAVDRIGESTGPILAALQQMRLTCDYLREGKCTQRQQKLLDEKMSPLIETAMDALLGNDR